MYMHNPSISIFILRALLAAVFTAVSSALAGSFMVMRGLSFMASAVAHAALGGAALGIYLQSSGIAPWFHPLIGVLLFGAAVALLTGYAGEKGVIVEMEKAVGVSFAFSMSLAVFFMYYIPVDKAPRIWGYFVGDILLLTEDDILLLTVITLIVLVFGSAFFREFIYISFDMESSTAFGLNASMYNYLLLLLTALSVTVTTKAVGAILAFSVLIAPAAAASKIGGNVSQIVLLAFVFSLASQFIGIAASVFITVSPTAITGLFSSALYLLSLLRG